MVFHAVCEVVLLAGLALPELAGDDGEGLRAQVHQGLLAEPETGGVNADAVGPLV